MPKIAEAFVEISAKLGKLRAKMGLANAVVTKGMKQMGAAAKKGMGMMASAAKRAFSSLIKWAKRALLGATDGMATRNSSGSSRSTIVERSFRVPMIGIPRILSFFFLRLSSIRPITLYE